MTVDQNSKYLFGGAITANIAKDWLDASDLRQVPDNQEVLLSPNNDLTLITEVLESVKEGSAKDDLEAAIRFHFDSLAHDNDATSSEVQEIYAIPGTSPGQPALSGTLDSYTPTPAPLLLVGHQTVKKFGQGSGAGDRVRIYLALWRFTPAKDVDLILSLNEPLASDALANAEQASRIEGSLSATAQEAFMHAASSLKVQDWGLFAH